MRENDVDAQTRLLGVLGSAPEHPALRDIQFPLARENGFAGWAELKRALAPNPIASINTIQRYEEKAVALFEAYRKGTPEAMERHYRHTWHRRSWQCMRTYVQIDLGKRRTGVNDNIDITLDDARYLVATEHGFENWNALLTSIQKMPGGVPLTAKPFQVHTARCTDEIASDCQHARLADCPSSSLSDHIILARC